MCLSIFRIIYLCVFLTTCIIAKRSIGIRTRVSVMKVFHLFGNTLYYLLPQQSVLCCDHLDKYEQEQVQLDAYHAPVRYTNVHVCISHNTLHIRFVFRVIAFSFLTQCWLQVIKTTLHRKSHIVPRNTCLADELHQIKNCIFALLTRLRQQKLIHFHVPPPSIELPNWFTSLLVVRLVGICLPMEKKLKRFQL